MPSSSQLPFPGSRTLAQWWRQLQPVHPRALWVGHLYLHRLEAPVRSARRVKLDPLAHLVLQALSLEPAASACCGDAVCAERLPERLHLPAAVLHQILNTLQKDALVQQAGGGWITTERGRQGLQQQEYPVERQERRVFPFVERLDEQGQRRLPPQYLPLGECPATPWHVQESEQLDPALLMEAVRQPPAWKQEFGFPGDVAEAGAEVASASWRRVLVDRPEQVFLALAQCGTEVLGFAVHVDSWALADTPVLRLPLTAAQSVWPLLREKPETGLVREAWLGWCRQRSLPMGEADASELSYHLDRVEVRAPERLLHRLRSARSDVFKGEAWLLLGTGPLRPAVVLQMHSRTRADAELR